MGIDLGCAIFDQLNALLHWIGILGDVEVDEVCLTVFVRRYAIRR